MNVAVEYDAIVVGGGPAGSSCATILAQAGMKTLVLEKAAFPRPKICGDCIHPKAWPLFDRLGVSEKFRQNSHRVIRRLSVTNQGGKSVSVDLQENNERPFFSMQRSEFDDILLRHAADRGTEVLTRHEMIGVKRDSDVWEIEVRNNSNSTISWFRCRVLIGADGRNSRVGEQFRRLGLVRHSHVRKDRCGVQWHTQYQETVADGVEMYLFALGYAGVVNCSNETATIGMVTSPDIAAIAKRDFPLFLRKTLHSNDKARCRIPLCAPTDNVFTASPIHPRRTLVEGQGARLIGDARQTVEPFTGQGVLLALHDGISAGLSIVEERTHPPQKSLIESHFMPNHFFSPVLRKPSFAESAVSFASYFPSLVTILGKVAYSSR